MRFTEPVFIGYVSVAVKWSVKWLIPMRTFSLFSLSRMDDTRFCASLSPAKATRESKLNNIAVVASRHDCTHDGKYNNPAYSPRISRTNRN